MNNANFIVRMNKLRILLLNAFHTGSHASWANEFSKKSKHDVQLLSLPGFHWKWRMHGASIEFNRQLKAMDYPVFDCILCTDMMDLALFSALSADHYANIPKVVYFHENQISYPWSPTDADPELNRDRHYGFINYTSALVASRVLFNSAFHKSNFLDSLRQYLKALPDFNGIDQVDVIQSKSFVLAPGVKQGIKIEAPQRRNMKTAYDSPVILWNHRWEYDKNPQLFFDTLKALKRKQIKFKLIVLGESFKSSPAIFQDMKAMFKDEILHWGFVESRQEYYKMLSAADVLPVCSIQEFFGMSLMEAILSGVYPLLPNRLVYPEHIPEDLKDDYLYDSDEELLQLLESWIQAPKKVHSELAQSAKQHLWKNLIFKYDEFFSGVVL